MELSEEEKKAIELLRNKNTEYYYRFIDVRDAVSTLLNLIDNQQKEIEEKSTIIFAGAEKVKQLENEIKDLKETNEDNAEKSLLNDIFIKKNYISKDKIRELLKKLRKEEDRIEKLDYRAEPEEAIDVVLLRIADLQELLEEN